MLAELHLEAMYELDADGRVLACTNPEVPPHGRKFLATANQKVSQTSMGATV